MSIRIQGLRVEAESASGRAVLIEDLSCVLEAPRTAVIGENGSGKSTLTKAIAGLITPSAGTVAVHGADTVTDRKALRRRVGFLFANPAAQAIMPTVREDVALSLRGRKLGRERLRQVVEEALAEHHLLELADQPCQTLSSGQLQRLAMCSVMVTEPRLIIADEPTSLLDARHRRIITDRLLAPAAEQVLLVTHDLSLAARCDEAILIADGKLTRQGPPAEVIAAYEESLGLGPEPGELRG